METGESDENKVEDERRILKNPGCCWAVCNSGPPTSLFDHMLVLATI